MAGEKNLKNYQKNFFIYKKAFFLQATDPM